jgi:hypothetical protein
LHNSINGHMNAHTNEKGQSSRITAFIINLYDSI